MHFEVIIAQSCHPHGNIRREIRRAYLRQKIDGQIEKLALVIFVKVGFEFPQRLFPIDLNTLLPRCDAMNINYAQRLQATRGRKDGWPSPEPAVGVFTPAGTCLPSDSAAVGFRGGV